MKQFRKINPNRNYAGAPKRHYRDYRDELKQDFNGRCAYTDCSHKWWADGFHIDHFVPKKPKLANLAHLVAFQEREHLYTNLVYACPQVNRAKGNDWPSEDPEISIVEGRGYIDPCSDFNQHFERTDTGAIVPKAGDTVAAYMWQKLRLYLSRYELYWRIDEISLRTKELLRLRDALTLPAADRAELLEAIADLTQEQTKYLEYLEYPVELNK